MIQDQQTWWLWSYNDSSEGVDDWEDDDYTVSWIQSNSDGSVWMGFSERLGIYEGGAVWLLSATASLSAALACLIC